MLRLRDLLLLCVIVASVVVGVFELGRHVDSESTSLSGRDSELSRPGNGPTHKSGSSRHTIELAAGAVGGSAGVIVLLSLGSALARPRRRTWRASN
jgi:hypothetical protein